MMGEFLQIRGSLFGGPHPPEAPMGGRDGSGFVAPGYASGSCACV